MSALENVVVIGAGGNLGPHILRALTEAAFNVTVLTRASSTSTFPGFPVVKVADDYPYNELVSAFKGQDVVISVIASKTTDKQKTMIDACIEVGVKRFIPAEFGSGANTLEEAFGNPLYERKYAIKQYLVSKESTGLTWTGVGSNAFFESGIETGFLGFDLGNKKVRVLGTGDERWATTTWKTIGLATARILQKPAETANKFIYIQSFRTSQNELLSQLERSTGVKWAIEKLDPELFVGEDQKLARGKGDADAIYAHIWAHFVAGDDWPSKPTFGNEMLGLPKEDLTMEIDKIVKK